MEKTLWLAEYLMAGRRPSGSIPINQEEYPPAGRIPPGWQNTPWLAEYDLAGRIRPGWQNMPWLAEYTLLAEYPPPPPPGWMNG